MTFTRFVCVLFLLLIFLQLLHPLHSEWNPAGHGVIKANSSMVSQDLKDVQCRGKTHRPAMCAGVVAKGYSLALPDESTTIGAAFLVVGCW